MSLRNEADITMLPDHHLNSGSVREKRPLFIFKVRPFVNRSRAELATKESGSATCETATEFKFGLTGPSMKASGRKIGLMEREDFGMLMETTLKANGRTTRPTAKGSMCTRMAPSTRVTGSTTCSTERALSPGTTCPVMRASTETVRRKDTGNITGLMVQSIADNGVKTSSSGLEFTHGQTGE